ncbi:hypothetical protein [Vibrio hippocampi]|nr:hypothetical protein [Vibrio hippocampi]
MKKSKGLKRAVVSADNQSKSERHENIHLIRKKIENILLEREQEKLWKL